MYDLSGKTDFKNITQIIILGHTGFIGSHLFNHLNKFPDVKVLGFSSSQFDLSNPKGVQGLVKYLMSNTAIVFCSVIKRQTEDSINSFYKNIQMITNLCKLPINKFENLKIVFLSSTAVYGEDIQHEVISEKTPVCPTSYYGISKYTSERLLLKAFSNEKKNSIVILRPPSVYGENEMEPSYGPSYFAYSIKNNFPIKLWGNGKELREFIYIDDLVKLVEFFIFRNVSGIFNIVKGESYSFIDMIRFAEDVAGRSTKIIERPRTKQKVDNIFDNRKLKQFTPDFKFTDIKQGILNYFQ